MAHFLGFRLRVAAIIVGLGLGAATTQAQFIYSAVNLGTLGGSFSKAFAVNDAGQVTGTAYTPGDASSHAFVYANGAMIDLGTLGGTYGSTGYGINQFGDVAGYSATAGNAATHAFSDIGGSMADLGVLSGATASWAYAINSSDQVVGYSTLFDRAFLSSGGAMIDLGNLGGYGPTSSSGARDINDAGQIVGWSSTAAGKIHAFSYANGVMSDLGAVDGANGGSDAFGINASGQIVGESTTVNDSVFHAFLYSAGSMLDLGTLGGSQSNAYGINDAGQIVGYSLTPTSGNTPRAFLYSGGTMLDLNRITDLSGTGFATLDEAYAISDTGYIAGYGHTTSGSARAFLLTPLALAPVPEPTTYGLIAGVVLLALAAWRLVTRRTAALPVPAAR